MNSNKTVTTVDTVELPYEKDPRCSDPNAPQCYIIRKFIVFLEFISKYVTCSY
jgi:hypothetical protein